MTDHVSTETVEALLAARENLHNLVHDLQEDAGQKRFVDAARAVLVQMNDVLGTLKPGPVDVDSAIYWLHELNDEPGTNPEYLQGAVQVVVHMFGGNSDDCERLTAAMLAGDYLLPVFVQLEAYRRERGRS